jgi:hypothetical protein
MATVNEYNPKIDLTVRVFDSFYDFLLEVPANEYDIVNSYFKSVFENNRIAQNFTTTLFRIANQTGTNVLTLLKELEGQDSIQLTATLAYYLNGLRSPATLLGVNAAVVPNFWAARNVLL